MRWKHEYAPRKCLRCRDQVQRNTPPHLCVICRVEVKSLRRCSKNRVGTFISSFLLAFKENRKLFLGVNFIQVNFHNLLFNVISFNILNLHSLKQSVRFIFIFLRILRILVCIFVQYQDQELCKEENICFLCRKKEILYYNSSCRCTLFCAVRVLKMSWTQRGMTRLVALFVTKSMGRQRLHGGVGRYL